MTWLPGAIYFAIVGFLSAATVAVLLAALAVDWAVKQLRTCRSAIKTYGWDPRYWDGPRPVIPPAPPELPRRADLEAALQRQSDLRKAAEARHDEPSSADVEHVITAAIRATREAAAHMDR